MIKLIHKNRNAGGIKKWLKQTIVRGGDKSDKRQKIKSLVRSNLISFAITSLIIIGITVSAIGIGLNAQNVKYRNNNQDKSVKEAIDDLYEKAEQCSDEDGVPLTYTKLNYLESTGTQYIDTEYTFRRGMRFKMKSRWLEFLSNGYLFGANSGSYEVLFGYKGIINYLGGRYEYQWSTDTDYIIDLDLGNTSNNLILTVNGDIIRNVFSYPNGKKCYMFAVVNMYYDVPSIHNYTYTRLYYFKIYDGNNLVRDYIPVLDSNDRPCMFDKVSKTCFYNKCTGEFLYG